MTTFIGFLKAGIVYMYNCMVRLLVIKVMKSGQKTVSYYL